jgi:glycosyltransferase involved in cell wall biosynthesis
MGHVSEDARAKLKAANVRVFETSDAADAARYLSQASVFVQTQLTDEFPTSVAQAMAMGLPCLTSDTRTHRDAILHGQTGFICTSERDFVERLTTLISNAAERTRIGNAARAEARRRFTGGHFRRRLLRLYGFDETRLRSARLDQKPGTWIEP